MGFSAILSAKSPWRQH